MPTNSSTTTALHKSKIDVPERDRTQLVTLLNETLADAIDLQSQVKVAHWNVKGMNFIALHELFDSIAAIVVEQIDTVAERITALGGIARGSVRRAAADSRIPEYPNDIHDGKSHVAALIERVAAYAHNLRLGIETSDTIGDPDTNDLYVEISRAIEKQLWFLEAHLQGSDPS
ncbi:MAG TPA: DNA starvation/stationary phase protection protein Dps [Candidatus Dormibacteraeota bacterium]|nr:DNA starvation/stationary phase protection protein Dps [Candidatus Dormibacteraeota bacterium]